MATAEPDRPSSGGGAFAARLREPVSGASLAAFRIGFGVVMAVAIIRFLSRGWVTSMYVEPGYYFSYPGLEWIVPLPGPGMHLLFLGLLGAALAIAIGFAQRTAALLFFLGFSYVELIDKTHYLNHYYLVSLLALLLTALPACERFVWRPAGESQREGTVPRWTVLALRLQFAIVYGFAGLAKVNSDWLLRAEPMRSWSVRLTEIPLAGGLLAQPWAPYVASWSGALYDLTIPIWLLWSRTRPLAYGTVLAFHVLTALFFPIGMFPWIMIVGTLVFFPPEWPDRATRRLRRVADSMRSRRSDVPLETVVLAGAQRYGGVHPRSRGHWLGATLILYFVLQIAVPLRRFAHSEDARWTERSFRFGWNVMVVDKAGFAEFEVVDESTGRRWSVDPSHDLTFRQLQKMSTKPDMVFQFAQELDKRFRREGISNPKVYARVYVSFNGRRRQPLVDASIDLTQPDLQPCEWILPLDAGSATLGRSSHDDRHQGAATTEM